MTVKECAEMLKAEIVNMPDADRKIDCGYAGDLLSFVIGKAPSDSVWFTVMNNVNVCAVATLADVSAVVLCEGVSPDNALKDKAVMQGVNLMTTDLDICSAIKALSGNI